MSRQSGSVRCQMFGNLWLTNLGFVNLTSLWQISDLLTKGSVRITSNTPWLTNKSEICQTSDTFEESVKSDVSSSICIPLGWKATGSVLALSDVRCLENKRFPYIALRCQGIFEMSKMSGVYKAMSDLLSSICNSVTNPDYTSLWRDI